ncbi:MAG: alpha-isopropylmalate synthase regulatory domain-containing protein, partial [Verrucomicrobiota bacterium]
GLDFSNLNNIRNVYQECTRMIVPERQPYGGELVFTAFSGSHQDAIKKGLDRRRVDLEENGSDHQWGVPYLTIDPQDIGRNYEALIRINSQSGKGGVAYILDRDHGYDLPKTMHPQVGKPIYDRADAEGRELTNPEIRDLFIEKFVNIETPYALGSLDYETSDGQVTCRATVSKGDINYDGSGTGNGPLNAFAHAVEQMGIKDFVLVDYRSQALRGGSDADSAAYVQVKVGDSDPIWGVGVDSSIERAAIKALISAWNLALAD